MYIVICEIIPSYVIIVNQEVCKYLQKITGDGNYVMILVGRQRKPVFNPRLTSKSWIMIMWLGPHDLLPNYLGK